MNFMISGGFHGIPRKIAFLGPGEGLGLECIEILMDSIGFWRPRSPLRARKHGNHVNYGFSMFLIDFLEISLKSCFSRSMERRASQGGLRTIDIPIGLLMVSRGGPQGGAF